MLNSDPGWFWCRQNWSRHHEEKPCVDQPDGQTHWEHHC